MCYIVFNFPKMPVKTKSSTRKWSQNSRFYCLIEKVAKKGIELTPYVCTERIFDRRLFMNNRIFLKRLLWKLVLHILTLVLHLLHQDWSFFGGTSFGKMLENGKIVFFKENYVDFKIWWKFRVSMWLEWLTNLNAKGAKRRVKI